MSVLSQLQALSKQGHGFAVFPEVRIFDQPGGKSIQHLLFGDFITPPKRADGAGYVKWSNRYLKSHAGKTWLQVRCRQVEGWILFDEIQTRRLLEVNFVDIGQGDGCHLATPADEHFIIDAGKGDNMYRFLRWRFNLARPGKALPKFHAVISHPDEDHYKGFMPLFTNQQNGHRAIHFKKLYHNGIIQRAGSTLGESIMADGRKYLTGYIATHKQLLQVLKASGKKSNYEKLLTTAIAATPGISIEAVGKEMDRQKILYRDKSLKMEVLGPVLEKVNNKKALRWFSDDVGKTKNGHSVVLMAQIGKLKVLLGGDLNSRSADYLMSQYSGRNLEQVKKDILQANGNDTTLLRQELQDIINACRPFFQSEVAKSCHHGSHDITNEFLQAVNPIATIISSGDEESFCHPRPETLGAIGKYSRGERPLIYSTELARSSPEYIVLEAKKIKSDKLKQKVVSTYGMITLRTDGERVIIAQKLEKQRSSFGLLTKWQIDKLIWNDERGGFVSKK